MKKIILIITMNIALITMTGCGTNKTTGSQTRTSEKEAEKKEAILDNTINKGNQNQMEDQYMKSLTHLYETISISADVAVNLLDPKEDHGLSSEQWLASVYELGNDIQIACEDANYTTPPYKYKKSDVMLKDSISDLMYFAETVKDISSYINNGGNNDRILHQLALGIRKFGEATEYRHLNEE